MKVTNHVKGIRGEAMERMARYCIGYLSLSKSKRELILITSKNQIKETGAKGLTGVEGNAIIVCLDSRLNERDMLDTMAHEMVHVQQLAKGMLVYRMDGDVETAIWRGKDMSNMHYLARPWELQAMGQSEIIVRRFYYALELMIE